MLDKKFASFRLNLIQQMCRVMNQQFQWNFLDICLERRRKKSLMRRIQNEISSRKEGKKRFFQDKKKIDKVNSFEDCNIPSFILKQFQFAFCEFAPEIAPENETKHVSSSVLSH